MRLCLGPRAFEVRARALVMGVLDRQAGMDRFLAAAERHLAEGADILDVPGVTAGPPGGGAAPGNGAVPGERPGEDTGAEEPDGLAAAVAALTTRFDVAVSVRTSRAAAAAAAFGAGACLGHGAGGPADPAYLAAVARAGAGVVVAAGDGAGTGDVVAAAEAALLERAAGARAAGIAPERIVVDAGLDLAGTPERFATLLRASDRLAGLGHLLLVSTCAAPLAGGPPAREDEARREAGLAAAALGVALGGRIVRTGDVRGARRVCDAIAAVLEAA